MLRTRAPLSSPKRFSFDLHVLGPPQTFALSQDQTLQFDVLAAPQWLIGRTFGFDDLHEGGPRAIKGCRPLLIDSPAGGLGCACAPFSPVGRECRTVRFVVRVPALQFSGSEVPIRWPCFHEARGSRWPVEGRGL